MGASLWLAVLESIVVAASEILTFVGGRAVHVFSTEARVADRARGDAGTRWVVVVSGKFAAVRAGRALGTVLHRGRAADTGYRQLAVIDIIYAPIRPGAKRLRCQGWIVAGATGGLELPGYAEPQRVVNGVIGSAADLSGWTVRTRSAGECGRRPDFWIVRRAEAAAVRYVLYLERRIAGQTGFAPGGLLVQEAAQISFSHQFSL